MNGCLSDPKNHIMRLRTNRGPRVSSTVDNGLGGLEWGEHASGELCEWSSRAAQYLSRFGKRPARTDRGHVYCIDAQWGIAGEYAISAGYDRPAYDGCLLLVPQPDSGPFPKPSGSWGAFCGTRIGTLGLPRAFTWMKVENGEVHFRRTSVRIVGLSYNSKGRARAPGTRHVLQRGM